MKFQPTEYQRSKPFSNKVLVRLVIYAVVLGYLALDLFVLKGFVHERLYQEAALKPALGTGEEELLALCHGEAIRRKDLRARVTRLSWMRGIDYATASASERLALRRLALEEMLLERHLVVRARLQGVRVEAAAVDEEVAMLWRSWGGKQKALERLEIINWDEAKFRQAIKREQVGAAYLEQLIAPNLNAIGEEQARTWFLENQEEFVQARRARFGQVFLSKLNRDAEQVGQKLANLREQFPLVGGKIAAQALVQSEDERSKLQGGSLGIIAFAQPAPEEGLDSLPSGLRSVMSEMVFGEDRLVESDIGWHWLWLEDDWEPARALKFEEVKEEILLHLRNRERQAQLKAIKEGLRKERHQVWLNPNAEEELPEPLPSLRDFSATAREVAAPAQMP